MDNKIYKHRDMEKDWLKTKEYILCLSYGAGDDDDFEFLDVLPEELNKSVPFLTPQESFLLLLDGALYIECKNEEELQDLFSQVLGDDQGRDYRYNVYAVTYYRGDALNENT